MGTIFSFIIFGGGGVMLDKTKKSNVFSPIHFFFYKTNVQYTLGAMLYI